MKNIADNAKKLCEKIVNDMGYELYDVVYKKEADGMHLTFYIDKDGGIGLEDCEAVSLAVETILDQANITSDVGYALDVSSLGLDWPIKEERDFKRNQGKVVEISLFAKQDGHKNFVGTLENWTEAHVTIQGTDGLMRVFARKDISHIAPHI